MTQADSSTIIALQKTVAKWYIMANGVLLIAVAALSYFSGQNFIPAIFLSCLALGITISSGLKANIDQSARIMLATGFALQFIAIVLATTGFGPIYVQQAHMMFFIFNAYLLGLTCWKSLFVFNVIVVVHHFALTIFAPSFVWGTGQTSIEEWINLVVHGTIAVVLAGPLMFTAKSLRSTLNQNEQAIKDGVVATQSAEETAKKIKTAQVEMNKKTDNVLQTVGVLNTKLKDLFGSVLDSAKNVDESSHQISNVGTKCNEYSNLILKTAENTADNLSNVAASTEELSQSVKTIALAATDSVTTTQTAVKASELSNSIMKELQSSSEKIGSIVGVIDDITETTNLLALNATIEAARAGEAGKSFAVVAQEVGVLADQTKNATSEVSAQIAQIKAETAKAMEAISSMTDAASASFENANSIAKSTSEQSAATHEIASMTANMSSETTEAKGKMAEVAKMLSEVSIFTEELKNASNELNLTANDSTRECDHLLEKLRAC